MDFALYAVQVKVPAYNQDGLQTQTQLSDMLDVQLAVVWPLEKPCLDRILLREEGNEGIALLDVGCGNGAWDVRVAETYKNLTVTGVDLEQSNVDKASQRAGTSPASARLSHFTANAYELSQQFRSGTFDVAACRSVLYTLPHADRVVVEI